MLGLYLGAHMVAAAQPAFQSKTIRFDDGFGGPGWRYFGGPWLKEPQTGWLRWVRDGLRVV